MLWGELPLPGVHAFTARGGITSQGGEAHSTLEMARGILAFTLSASVTLRRSFSLKSLFPYLSWGERQTVNIC